MLVGTEAFEMNCIENCGIDAVDERSLAAESTSTATAAGEAFSDKDDITSSADDDDDDGEYGFDPTLHIWHPPENPVITDERPYGIVIAIIRYLLNN